MEESSKKNVVNHFEAGSNCQVFNGNITDCVFAMPGSTVSQGRINENQNENTKQARADESLLSVCRAKGVSTEGQNQNYKERVIDNKVLKKAVGKVKPFMWAASAYAVLYCVCRDCFEYSGSISQFEREIENIDDKYKDYDCKKGTIINASRNNSYYKYNVESWQKRGAKEKVLILRDRFKEAMKSVMLETDIS